MYKMNPLVTIITSSYQRNKFLLERCIPSVQNQTYRPIEHIIVHDGENKKLKSKIKLFRFTKLICLGRNWHVVMDKRSLGAIPRMVGTYLAKGKYCTYLDDDDEYLPKHVEKLVNLIQKGNVDFALSQMKCFWLNGKEPDIVGNGKIELGQIGTPMILHKTELIYYGNWDLADNRDEDYNLVKKWVDSSRTYAFLPEVTSYYYRRV